MVGVDDRLETVVAGLAALPDGLGDCKLWDASSPLWSDDDDMDDAVGECRFCRRVIVIVFRDSESDDVSSGWWVAGGFNARVVARSRITKTGGTECSESRDRGFS